MDLAEETRERLEEQIDWYDKKSLFSQKWYKRSKVTVIVAAALIPLSVNVPMGEYFSAFLGAVILIVEGLQHLNQYHQNWTTYRSTCEALKHEKFLWIGRAGPYETADNPNVMLAERIEALISQEHAKWVSTRQEAAKKPASSSTSFSKEKERLK